MNEAGHSIGIIGFGPKGLYAFERLLAHLKSQSITLPVHIYLFNRTKFFGSGDVYRSDQPSYLKMNFQNKYISMWSEEKPKPILNSCFSFSAWKAIKTKIPIEEVEKQYGNRKEVGLYLEESYLRLCQHLPWNVKVIEQICEVETVLKSANQFELKIADINKQTETFPVLLDSLLLTTGHQKKIENTAQANLVDFIYPVTKRLIKIEKNSNVALKGMGLTFIDAALALTEGRNGTFKATEEGFNYAKSGNEPTCIYPFSVSGIPMIPRISVEIEKATESSYLSLYLKNCNKEKPFSFENDLLPEIEKDIQFAYYHRLFKQYNQELLYFSDYKAVEQQLVEFHKNHPNLDKFTLEKLFFPIAPNNPDRHEAVFNYLEYLKRELKNPNESPIIAASSTWRNLSDIFNSVYSFGGLDTASQLKFDRFYAGKFNRISYGPPLENMDKILALAKAGIINFSFAANPTVISEEDQFILSNESTNQKMRCNYLIDARIPKIDAKQDSIYAQLCENKLAKLYTNRAAENGTIYYPGNVEINEEGKLINADGLVEDNVHLYGTPTEGLTYDNDTLSRERNNFANSWAISVIEAIQKKDKTTIIEKNKSVYNA